MTGRRRPTLILFARAPRLGRVKTRLAAALGTVPALVLYRGLLVRGVRAARDRRWDSVLAVTPDRARGPWAGGLPTVPQGGGPLGRRMLRALAAALRPGRPALLVGSDLPALRPRHLAACFALLRRPGWVLGPAEDGGFWAIGRSGRAVPPATLDGVPWSTARALAETRARLPGRVALGPRLADLDTCEDLRRLRP